MKKMTNDELTSDELTAIRQRTLSEIHLLAGQALEVLRKSSGRRGRHLERRARPAAGEGGKVHVLDVITRGRERWHDDGPF
jgi:hypothetical protein